MKCSCSHYVLTSANKVYNNSSMVTLLPAWRAATTSSRYPRFTDSLALLEMVRLRLGVRRYRLCKMLGCSLPGAVSCAWWGGRSRPSALYMSRLLMLVILHADGKLDIQRFDGRSWGG